MTSPYSQPVDLRLSVESSLEMVASSAYCNNLELGYLIDDDAPDAILCDAHTLQSVVTALLYFCVSNLDSGFVQVLVRSLLLYGNRYQLRFSVNGVRQDVPISEKSKSGSGPGKQSNTLDELLTFCSQQMSLLSGRMTVEEGLENGYRFHLNLQAESVPVSLPAYRESFQPLLQYRQVLVLSPHIINRDLLLQQSKRWGLITRTFQEAKEIPGDLLEPGAFDLAILDSFWACSPSSDSSSGIYLPGDLPVILCDCPGGQYPIGFQGDQIKAQLAKPIVPSRLYDALTHLLG